MEVHYARKTLVGVYKQHCGCLGQQPIAGHDAESALDILQKRYARGEISTAEYQDIRQELHEKE
jgi:uncharacterized membrane protein